MHRFDPRVKIVGAVLFSCVAAVSVRWESLALAFSVAATLLSLAKPSLRQVLRRLLLANFFILCIWLFLPFTHAGAPLMHIGPLTATVGGVEASARITLKANTILLAFIALVATMPVATLGHALRSLAVPEKLVYLLLFTYRYIHVMEQEYRRLHNAAIIRGFQPKTDRHTYKTYAYLVGMLLVRSLARAERVHDAMLCRGFQGRFYALRPFHITFKDIASL
ncbi:MAG: cobalt ECF transporter T component CbiQ, partial [Desulfobulbaceae bacterium]|nr:cobalt ECF transporter T component CbiQ [Desulfobulbaceae bacterium]